MRRPRAVLAGFGTGSRRRLNAEARWNVAVKEPFSSGRWAGEQSGSWKTEGNASANTPSRSAVTAMSTGSARVPLNVPAAGNAAGHQHGPRQYSKGREVCIPVPSWFRLTPSDVSMQAHLEDTIPFATVVEGID